MSSATVSFINPSGKYNHDPYRNQPLTIMYLLTYLEKHFGDSLDLSIVDLRSIPEEDFLYHIPEQDIYMYTVTTLDFNEAETLVKNLRVMYPNAKHIAGGRTYPYFLMMERGFSTQSPQVKQKNPFSKL